MPATLSRSDDGVRQDGRRDVRRSWAVLALIPPTLLASALVAGRVVDLLVLAPALLAHYYGQRANREGIREGIVPAMLGAAFAAAFFTLNLFALVFGR